MESLVRSRVGIFGIKEAHTLKQIETLCDQNRITDIIIRPDEIFGKNPAVVVTEHGRKMAENGNMLRVEDLVTETDWLDEEQIRVYDGAGKFYGIYQYNKNSAVMKPIKMFL